MNKSKEISAQLWDMANKLRGTMDASEYKNYILPFMFYRYLSEKQDNYLKENGLEDFYTASGEELREYLKDLKINLSYAVLPEYSWSELISKIADYKIKASDYQDMFHAFRDNATQNSGEAESLADIFSDMNLGDMRLGSDINERARALNEIVLMINDFNFKKNLSSNIEDEIGEIFVAIEDSIESEINHLNTEEVQPLALTYFNKLLRAINSLSKYFSTNFDDVQYTNFIIDDFLRIKIAREELLVFVYN